MKAWAELEGLRGLLTECNLEKMMSMKVDFAKMINSVICDGQIII